MSIVLYTVGSFLTNYLINFMNEVASTILLFKHVIQDTNTVQKLDQYLSQNGYSGYRSIDKNMPIEGKFYLWIDGPIILHKTKDSINDRSTNKYIIYTLLWDSVNKLSKKIATIKSTNIINTKRIVVKSAWQIDIRDFHINIPSNIYEWQDKLLKIIMKANILHNNQDSNLDSNLINYLNGTLKQDSIIISGDTGIGKSTIGRLIKNRSPIDIQLIEGFDPNVPGLIFEDVIINCSKNTDENIILMIDEIDISMDNTFNSSGKTDFFSHAQNKTTFNKLLDNINDYPHLLLIATTNKSLDELTNKYPEYMRKGRFNVKYEITDTMEIKEYS
jgi:hypothetical protein